VRLLVAAVGRARKGDPGAALFHTYADRSPWALELREIPARNKGVADEGERLLAARPPNAATVALDERGRALTSEAFAETLDAWRVDAVPAAAFLIGGADGHADAVLRAADLRLSLGPMTWPHMLVRAMLAEQLYRAQMILQGHPYHRG